MSILFSIIIPHKDIPNLLERLISSIPVREDLEIIVVDDHSDSSVVNFAHFPGKDRRNFKLLSNKGKRGAGYARNYALPFAIGRWIIFADSDDFFNSGFNEFLNMYVDSEADVVYFNANSVDTNTYEPCSRADHLHGFISEYQNNHERGELMMRHMFTEPWCKMIKRTLIKENSILFDDTSIHEDVKFACLVGLYAKSIIVDDRQLYCVTSRIDSLSRTLTLQKYLDELKVFSWWKRYLMRNRIPLELPKFDYRAYNFARHIYKNNKLFCAEYEKMREGGLPHTFILWQILKYLWKSVRYKLKI